MLSQQAELWLGPKIISSPRPWIWPYWEQQPQLCTFLTVGDLLL
jgi:hypothetical protein